jgi:hypothetical protein
MCAQEGLGHGKGVWPRKRTRSRPPTTTHEAWLQQDFPYNVEPGVQHHNVWATRPLSPAELDTAVAEHRPPAEWDAVHFINPVSLASIPAIWHAHVLSRLKPTI